MNKKIAGLAAGATILLTSACGASAVSDRPESAGGKDADATKAATKVTIYLNADSVPNIAVFCAGDRRWASTLSGGDQGGDKAATLVRLPEEDSLCGAGAR